MLDNLITARRIDAYLKYFPQIRRKIEAIAIQYFQIREHWNYNIDYNGERWLVQCLTKSNVLKNAFDVGANRGDWAAMVLVENPNADVHCFELCSPTFRKLAARFSENNDKHPRVFLNPFGLSDSQADIKVNYFANEDEKSTIFEPLNPPSMESMIAQVMRGEDYCAKHNVTTIDCLKIDVEGAEHLVLHGFGKMVSPATISVIQFEYGRINIETKFLLRDFYSYFEKRGYKVGKLFPSSVRFCEYSYEDENFLGPNYIAASPQIAGLLEKQGG